MSATYDSDFYRWTQETAELIRQGRWPQVDLEHVAEEIENMGKRDQREIRSRLIVLIGHLLKWQFQPELRDSSTWRAPINEQRTQLALVLADSPSLFRIPGAELPRLYMSAIRRAMGETGLSQKRFPQSCPYTMEQILDPAFFPES